MGIMEPPPAALETHKAGRPFRVQIPLRVCVVALPRPEICDAFSVGSPAVWHLLDRQSHLTAISLAVWRFGGRPR